MSKLDRYMLSQFMALFGFFALILVAIFWINRAVRMFDRLIGDGQSALVFLEFSALTLPVVIGTIMPIAAFAAAVYVANRVINESELVVMQATGFSPWRLSLPVVLFGLIIALTMSLMVHFLIPASRAQLHQREIDISRNITPKLLTPGEFLHPTDGITFFISEITANGVLRDVFLSDRRDPGRSITYTAEESYLVQQEGTTRLVMVNGMAQTLRVEQERLSTVQFDDFSYDVTALVNRRAADLNRLPYTPTADMLRDPAGVAARAGASRAELNYELHSRFAQTLFCIVAATVGFATLMLGGFSRFGVWWQILSAFGLLVMLKVVESAVAGQVLASASAWPLIYLPVALGTALIVAMLFWASHPRLLHRRPAPARAEARP